MFKAFANIIFSPMHWMWDNIINVSIYGVKVWQITVLMVCFSLFFRIFIIPTIGGTNFSIHTPKSSASVGSVAKSSRYIKSNMKEDKL